MLVFKRQYKKTESSWEKMILSYPRLWLRVLTQIKSSFKSITVVKYKSKKASVKSLQVS